MENTIKQVEEGIEKITEFLKKQNHVLFTDEEADEEKVEVYEFPFGYRVTKHCFYVESFFGLV